MRRPEAGGARLALLLSLVLPAAALAQWEISNAKVTFEGKGPAGFRLVGTTASIILAEDGPNLRFTVPLATLETGIGLRDRHMREKYLETDKYPNAVLEVPWAALSLPEDGGRHEGSARGVLTLHGVRKEVDFTYALQRGGDVWDVSGELPLHITDFAIHIPSYLGITVKPDVRVRVRLTARGRPPAAPGAPSK